MSYRIQLQQSTDFILSYNADYAFMRLIFKDE